MQAPAFFDAVPAISVVDPLADALGAVEGGLIEYRYIDAAARRAFADTWQGWVQALVIDHADDPALIATT